MTLSLTDIFPVTLLRLSPEQRQKVAIRLLEPEAFPTFLTEEYAQEKLEGYLTDLARIELALYQVTQQSSEQLSELETLSINPTLILLEVGWQPLLPLLDGNETAPVQESAVLIFWRHPISGKVRRTQATSAELLALKMVSDNLDPRNLAEATDKPIGEFDAVLESAADHGLLLRPASRLRRDGGGFPVTAEIPEKFLTAQVFTLQWHITHRCDLHCRHCYDRSRRDDVPLQRGREILDQLRDFCLQNGVRGQVSFSGGNPFLHPVFFQLYQAAKDRNLGLAVLGNPVSESDLDRLLTIAKPAFFQVSLEGLADHNDTIRGAGNFARVMEFLDLLRRKKIYSMVMLTLTRANLNQVLPLAELLRDRVDLFTYNRLAMVGEGASLESPQPEEYREFLGSYLKASATNPTLALKDSLINIEKDLQKLPLFGGCTGFGCGAAFNFVSLLPDGQVHACRKFPSPIGDINQHSLAEIYASPTAQAYRNGCRECTACRLRPVCGGCLAVAYGFGLDPLTKKDPCCFFE